MSREVWPIGDGLKLLPSLSKAADPLVPHSTAVEVMDLSILELLFEHHPYDLSKHQGLELPLWASSRSGNISSQKANGFSYLIGAH